MRALIQRVSRAHVRVDEKICGSIRQGLVIFLGIREGDTDVDAAYLARRIANLRIFHDRDAKMNLSLLDINGEALVISQFTLYADTRKGNRPSYTAAAKPELAEALYNHFIAQLTSRIGEGKVAAGIFRAMMKVELVNDGPVTILLQSKSGYDG